MREINRLGRDISDLFAVLKWLHDEGADLVVLTMDLDTRTPTGRLIFGILGLVSQWERELIVERSIAGQKAARERGRMPGARPKLNPQQQKEALRRVGKGEPIKIIAESYGVSRQAIYNLKWAKGK